MPMAMCRCSGRVVRYVIVCIAANAAGTVFPKLWLPRVTGYLLMGIIAGPFGLRLIPESDIRSLRFIDELSLAFIAYAAGAQLLLDKLQGRLTAVAYVTLGLVVFEYAIGSLTVFGLADQINFMQVRRLPACLPPSLPPHSPLCA